MKLSEVTITTVKLYCKITWDDEDALVEVIMSGAKAFIKSRTGMTEEEMDEQEDLTTAFLMMCNDNFINRTYSNYSTKSIYVNPAAEHILNLHRRNIL